MTPHDPHLPARLAAARRRFDDWRATRRRPCPIPPGLWKAAVRCAAKHGVYRTVRALGLDYNSLKRRVEAAAGAPPVPSSPQGFVELVRPASPRGPGECTLEVERPGGAKLRVELRGAVLPDLADLARRFAAEGA